MTEKSNVWYASDERFRTASKLIAFEDKGTLNGGDNALQFSGRKHGLSVTDIRNIELVRQPLPWITYLIMNVVLISIFVLFAWDRGTAAMIGAVVGVVFANALGAAICWQTKWIRIEHTDESGQSVQSYFADGSKNGWGGIFGGTEKLYSVLQSRIDSGLPQNE